MVLELYLCMSMYSSTPSLANTQQVLPVQTGLCWYDEWMMQDINDKNFNGSK